MFATFEEFLRDDASKYRLQYLKNLANADKMSLKPAQEREELFKLYVFIKYLKPKKLLEIGSRHGGSFYIMTKAMDHGSFAVSCDMVNGPWGEENSNRNLNAAVTELRKDGYIVPYPVYGNSSEQETIDQIKELSPFDFIFCDGDHTEEGVASDYRNYWPMLNIGGVMAFHDVSELAQVEKIAVYSFWKKLVISLPPENTTQFVRINAKYGIGLAYKAIVV